MSDGRQETYARRNNSGLFAGLFYYPDVMMEFLHHHITDRQPIGYNIPQAVVYSLMLLKIGEIDARNMSS
jgi:hypothetical protein